MSFDAGAGVVHRPRFDDHPRRKWDGEELGAGMTLSCPQTFVGNQVCNTCKSAFSGIETNKSGHRRSEARARAISTSRNSLLGRVTLRYFHPIYAEVRSQIQRENLIPLCLSLSFVFYSVLLPKTTPDPAGKRFLEKVKEVPSGSTSRRRENQRTMHNDFDGERGTRYLNHIEQFTCFPQDSFCPLELRLSSTEHRRSPLAKTLSWSLPDLSPSAYINHSLGS